MAGDYVRTCSCFRKRLEAAILGTDTSNWRPGLATGCQFPRLPTDDISPQCLPTPCGLSGGSDRSQPPPRSHLVYTRTPSRRRRATTMRRGRYAMVKTRRRFSSAAAAAALPRALPPAMRGEDGVTVVPATRGTGRWGVFHEPPCTSSRLRSSSLQLPLWPRF